MDQTNNKNSPNPVGARQNDDWSHGSKNELALTDAHKLQYLSV